MDNVSLKRLREWFKKNAAELPWRPADLDAPRDPYAVWISETMLQQTQVSTVRDYFVKWMTRFPDIETLAAASEDEVFHFWQGLGYYSRARNILKTAQAICGVNRPTRGAAKCEMPRTRKELEALPGIGAYTAGAILSLAYHQKEAILDGNLIRIFSRLFLLDFLPTDKTPTQKPRNSQGESCSETYWNYAREIADSPKAYMHNEALMELGRTICRVKNPECCLCPLQSICRAALENRTAEYPPSKKRTQMDWHGTVLVIESADHKILAVHGGQKFFRNQFTLPHFESPRGATAGIPAEAEDYIAADEISSVETRDSFRHGITVHKIECDVLLIRLGTTATNATRHLAKQRRAHPKLEFKWIEASTAQAALANSFSLKALRKAFG